MGFKSDKQRKGFFANKGNSSKTSSFAPRQLSKEEILSRSTEVINVPEGMKYSVSSKKFPKEKFFKTLKEAEEESRNQIRKGASSSAVSEARPVIVTKTKVKLSSKKDTDGDGVVDSKDCEPFNPKKQGFLHDLQVKRLRKKEEKLESQREKEMKKLEDLKDRLKERHGISEKQSDIKKLKLQQKQAIIDEINEEKRKTIELKEANKKAQEELDKFTVSGKVKTAIKKDSVLIAKNTQAFLQKKSTRKALSSIGKSLGL